MRFQFIAQHLAQYPLRLLCRALKVSRSGFYAWRKRPPSARKMADKQLLEAITELFHRNKGRYGSPRIYRALLRLKWRCSLKRVARLMRENALVAKRPRRRKGTTQVDKTKQPAPNRLNQQFTVAAPNKAWCADITYIPTREGWLYLAVVLDLFSRLIVGWSMRSDMSRQLVIDAFTMARHRRQISEAGLIHHSDRGSQYTSADFRKELADAKVQASMSGTGNCYDNAPAESWFATLKIECADSVFESHAAARTELFEYIEIFYNRKRLHSRLGYKTPVEYEQEFNQMNNVPEVIVY